MFNCDLEVFLLLRSRDLQVSDICTSCGDSYYYWLELITIIRTQSLLELSDCSHLKQLNPLWVAPVNHGCSDYLSLTTARLKKTEIRLSGSFLNCPISLVSDCVKSGGLFWSKSETMTSSGSFYRISRPINMLNYNLKLNWSIIKPNRISSFAKPSSLGAQVCLVPTKTHKQSTMAGSEGAAPRRWA